MGNPLRTSDPSVYRIATLRTVGARLWLTPNQKTARLIGGIIARYQELLGIEIYAYCVLGNHYHIALKAPNGNADEFFENVNREISRRMNWRLKREGQFWARRYSEQLILSEADLLEAFLYINTNPTHHGLLRDSARWKGLTSYHHAITKGDRKFSFTEYATRDGEPKKTTHTLRLSPLPQFQSLSIKARTKKLQKLLNERTESLVQEREKLGLGFMGMTKLLEQVPGEVPREVSRSPRPVCYTKCPKIRREQKMRERERRCAYAKASLLYRLGLKNFTFPEFTFFPPRHRFPRILPFQLVKLSDFQYATS